HTALDDIADPELFGDLLRVDGPALEEERGIACDDEEPAQLRQRRDDVLADAVGEILLLRIAAHVHKGKHGDAGPVGERHGGTRLTDLIRRWSDCMSQFVCLRAHATDKAETLARDGTYQLLVLAAVAN